jgi:phage tail-like protein
MATSTQRDRPYGQFNFQVLIGSDDGTGTNAGFQEVSGLGTEIHAAEYRAGNWKDNSPIKVTGSYKVPDITLKRGVIGELVLLHAWMKAVRDGGGNANGTDNNRRQVTIQLMGEDGVTVAQTWTLSNARPIKYTGPSLTGKGTDVAIEELVLAAEHIEVS